MTAYERARAALRAEPRTWLITGVAGFIGSHLLEALLNLGQRVDRAGQFLDRDAAQSRRGARGRGRGGVGALSRA